MIIFGVRYKVYLENEDDANEDSYSHPLPDNQKVFPLIF